MYSPDERRNIRADMNRDAAPSPEDVEREKRDHLSSEGCKECGEDDPDELSFHSVKLPSCPAVQAPPEPRIILCDECAEDRETLRERAFRKADEMNERDTDKGDVVAIAFYNCDSWEYVRQETIEGGHPHPHAQPTAPINCRCGAHLDEVSRLGEGDY